MLFFILIVCIFAGPIVADESVCKSPFRQCAPVGASRRGVPVIGPDLARFYDELVYTVQGIADSQLVDDTRPPGLLRRQEIEGDSLCCNEAAVCNLIRSFRIAFCWDRFTTAYFLPDGSYGSAANGSYITPEGDTANLISGQYQMQDGTHGNIYDESPADKPDTTDLPIPTPWTSNGVGEAIPASELGAQDTTVTPWSTSSTTSTTSPPELSTTSTESASSSTLSASPLPSPPATSTTSASTASFSGSTSMSLTTPHDAPSTTLTPLDTTSELTTSSNSGYNATSSANSEMMGTAGVSGTSTNFSSPIIPPITNLAAATVVYCMAVKVLAWMVTALVMA